MPCGENTWTTPTSCPGSGQFCLLVYICATGFGQFCLLVYIYATGFGQFCLLVYIYATVFGKFCLYLYIYISVPLSLVSSMPLCIVVFDQFSVYISVFGQFSVLGGSGGVVNSLDFCPASLESLGYFYFRCVLPSQWMAVTLTGNLQILHCQL